MAAQPANGTARPVTLDLKPLTTPATAVGSAGAVVALANAAGIEALAAIFLSYAVGLTVGVISALYTGQVATKERLDQTRADCQRDRDEDRAEIAELKAEIRDLRAGTQQMTTAALEAMKAVAGRG